MLKPAFDTIPAELQAYHQWVNWNTITRDGKPTKPPFQANGALASSVDPETWADFSTARVAASRFDGIGFVLTESDPFVGLDFDKCRCPGLDGGFPVAGTLDMVKPEIAEHLRSLNAYTEVSPSGRGIRVILKGHLPVAGKKKGSIEVYQTGRYVTVTGHALDGFPLGIEDRSAELAAFYEAVFGTNGGGKGPEPGRKPSLGGLGEWRERLERAFQSRSGPEIQRLWDGDHSAYPSQSEADLSMCSHLAFWFDGDAGAMDAAFRASGLMREKWDRPTYGDGRTYGQATVQKAVAGCRAFYGDRTHGEPGPAEIPKENGSPLTFPGHIMTGAAGYFSEVLADCMEPPQHFFFMAYMACLGAVLSSSITLKSELRPQTRLYLVILGESADDRKSTAVSKTVDFFQSALSEFHTCFGVGSAEGLQRRFLKDSNVLLVYDELKAFVGKAKVDGSVLLPCVCTLFESNRYESHTRDREIVLTGACLSILAASTIETYERCWDAAFQDIGMTNRLFIVPGQGKRRFAIPGQVPSDKRDVMKNDLGKILRIASMTPEFDITPGARALYEAWYLGLEQSVHTKRLDTYALKFLILLAVNASKSEVDAVIVQDVIDLMNWQLQARRLHDPIDADSAVAKVEEKIRRILKTGRRSDTELKRAVHYSRIGTWAFTNAIRNLTRSEEIYFDKKEKAWRTK